MGQPPAQCAGRGRSYFNSRAHKQQTVHNDQLAAREPLLDHDARIGRTARLHPLDRGFAVLDREHVDPFLVGDERGLGNHYFLFRCAAFDFDANKLSVDEHAGRIGKRGAHEYRVGVAIDLDIDEVDAAFLLVCPAPGKTKPRLDVADVDLASCRLLAQKVPLAHRKGDIHGILADDDRQWAALRAHDIALGDVSTADLSSDRGNDIGVTEVDPGRGQVGLVGHDRTLGLLILRASLVARDDGPGFLLNQVLRTAQLQRAERFRGLASLQGAFSLPDLCLEQSLFDPVQRRAFLDQVAFLEQHRFQESGDPRPNFDPADCFDPADIFSRLRDGPALRLGDADGNGGGWLLLGEGRSVEEEDHESSAKPLAHVRPQIAPSLRRCS